MQIFKNLSIGDYFSQDRLLQFLRIFIIVVVGFLSIKIVRLIIRKLLTKTLNRQSLMVVGKIITYLGVSLLALIVLTELGIDLTAILGAAGIFGLAIGVASQKSLGNIISGFFLVAEKQFELGDVIKVGDKLGIVYSIDSLSVILKTFDNITIRIPNETLISTEMLNITKFPIRRLDFNILISYKDDIEHTIEILRDIARENPYSLIEPAPFIMAREFGERGITMGFGVWFEKYKYIDAKNSLMIQIQKRFTAEGITIPYPQLTIHQAWPKDVENPGEG